MEVHCTNEEAGGKKQVLAEFRLEEVFLPFWNDRRPKKGDSGLFSTRVWKNKSLIICVQEGGEAPPKFEIFCVITCGLTTHKISIAAPAEAGHLYITTRKLTWRDV